MEQEHDITDNGTYDANVIEPALNHVVLLTGNSKVHNDLFLDGLADLVQNPHKRPTHAWVVKGPQGTGKTPAMELLIRPILGSDDPTANKWHGQ
eukprot:23089-Eustigmatos_ZCMA.PRE.1